MKAQVDMTTAVFSNGDKLILVTLEADNNESASAEAVARGYRYAGCIAISGGEPIVTIEPGYEAAVFRAGVLFAEVLGSRLKQQQTEGLGV